MNLKLLGILLIIAFALILTAGCTSPDSEDVDAGQVYKAAQSEAQEEVKVETASFSDKAVEYFKEIALSAEYEENPSMVRKWVKNPVIIRVHGSPDDESMACLDSVINDFNRLSTTVKLMIDGETEADIDIYFVPYSEFAEIEPNYVQDNWGFFGCWINSYCEIYKADILISTDMGNSRERCHLIREELTQSLGLASDSLRYPDSIFYIEWSDTNEYSELDRDLIRMLYSTDIAPCTTSEGVCSYFG